MSAVVFPTVLPTPSAMTLQQADRRLLAGMESRAPASGRALQRDRMATAEVTHTFTGEQYAIWSVWRQLALSQGGAWFSAPRWPFPWGVGGVVRYTGQPQVRHVGTGTRALTLQVEIRGSSAAPVTPDPVAPLSVVDIDSVDLPTYGAELVAMTRLVSSIDDVWHRVSAAGTDFELLGTALPAGSPVAPTRGSLPCGAVQFRGATDASNTLGRLGVVINGDNNTAAASRLSAGLADYLSRVTGSSTAGHTAVLPWDDRIELVHVGQLSMGGTYTVVDTGAVSAASSQFLRLTFNESDNIVALLLEEGPRTNYAGTPGTGSARQVRVRGIPGAVA